MEPSTFGPRVWYEPLINAVVDHRRIAVLFVILASAVFASFVPRLEADVTLKSGINTDTDQYRRYQEFLKVFGNEEFLLIAIKKAPSIDVARMLAAVEGITRRLERSERIVEVVSLGNLQVFQERDGRFGTYGVLRHASSQPALPEPQQLAILKNALPLMDLLTSEDRQTFGIMVRIEEQWRFDPPAIEEILGEIGQIVKENVPPGSEYRIIGAPVIRKAIHHYNIQTAIRFGTLCLLICTAVSFYIFKSLRAMLVTLTVVGLCDLWILGIMSILGIRITSTTALAFGLVLISSVEPVIHLVTHFNEALRSVADRAAAAKKALLIGAAPCLITSFTTSFGFSSLIVASLPMIRELGVILSLGPLFAFILSVALTPAFLTVLKPLESTAYDRMASDLLSTGFNETEGFVFRHHKLCVAAIFTIIGVMLMGAPMIKSDTQILRMLTESTPEIQDMQFVERNLAPVNSLELVLEAGNNAFKNPAVWRKVELMEQELKRIPEVAAVDSLLPLLEYLYRLVSGPQASPDGLFSNPRSIAEILFMMSMGSEGKRMLSRYLDDRFSQLHVSVRIRNSPDTTIGETIEKVRSAAQSAMGGAAKAVVTGDLAVFEAQASEIVSSQTYSLLLAVFYMSVLLTIQFRSIALGLASLLPQLLPQAVIFGIMGWFRISLDSVTVFAASVSIGLTVDNTVHYLTQLKREIRAGDRSRDIESCLSAAYEVTARAMISNHAVIFFGFAMLLFSPFRPVIAFGILGCAAIFFSLVGDLIFMPSVILSSTLFRRLLTREMTAR